MTRRIIADTAPLSDFVQIAKDDAVNFERKQQNLIALIESLKNGADLSAKCAELKDTVTVLTTIQLDSQAHALRFLGNPAIGPEKPILLLSRQITALVEDPLVAHERNRDPVLRTQASIARKAYNDLITTFNAMVRRQTVTTDQITQIQTYIMTCRYLSLPNRATLQYLLDHIKKSPFPTPPVVAPTPSVPRP